MRSNSRLLLSRIGQGQQRQPYSPVALHSANLIRFYTSKNPSEERSGVWNVLKNCLSWIKNKLEVRVIVPEAEAYVIERHGKYINTLTSGIHSMGSRHDKVAYVYSLKEKTISIPYHPAVTKDNVSISVDGSLCVKIVDPKLASYAVNKPLQSVIMLTQGKTRSQIGRMTLDETFEKRDTLNERILMEINDAVKDWGLECLCYEIRDISLPTKLKEMMEKLAIQDRERRASLLAEEAERQTNIKIAEEKMMSTILEARAEYEARVRDARAMAAKISEMSKRIKTEEGLKAEKLKLGKRCENTWRRILASSTIIGYVWPEETSKEK